MAYRHEDSEEVARTIASSLREASEAAEGVTVKGEKIAGAVVVMASPDGKTFTLVGGTEEQIRRRVLDKLGADEEPIGFVKWESRQVGKGYEVKFLDELLSGLPWARSVLNLAVDEAKRLFGRVN